jgi:hypothetical protein
MARDEIEWLRSMDKPSETSPPVDVVSSVMRRIRSAEVQSESDRAFSIVALFATLLGAAAAGFAIMTWLGMNDPLADLVEPLKLVLQ